MCRILHQVRRRGHWQVELHYKITSLSPDQASAPDLLQLSRSHWSIENQLHYVRDVTLGEDRSRIRTNPGVFARLRSFAFNILKANNTDTLSQDRYRAALAGVDNLLTLITIPGH